MKIKVIYQDVTHPCVGKIDTDLIMFAYTDEDVEIAIELISNELQTRAFLSGLSNMVQFSDVEQ